MIRYSLSCSDSHEFEAWFADGATCDAQLTGGQVTCPACGRGDVRKAIMAPSVSAATRRKGSSAGVAIAADRPMPAAARPPAHAAAADVMAAALPPEVRQALREIKAAVKANAEDVGRRFAEEARKIHYEEVPPRGIYGEASAEEARALVEEGVDVYALPHLPDDEN